MQQQHPGSLQSERLGKGWNPVGAGAEEAGETGFSARLVKSWCGGLRDSLSGTGQAPPKGFKCQHRYWVGSYSSSLHLHPKGGRVSFVGALEHLFLPFLRNARQRKNPRSGGLAPLPGCSVLGSAPLPTCHTSPHHTTSPHTPLDPSPCLSRPLRVPGQAGRSQAVSWAGSRGLSRPHGRTKPGERQRRRLGEARPLPRAG